MELSNSSRPTWAEIDLDNLAFNLNSVRRFVGEDVDCMAVVKADAYGHGAVECSRRFKKEGVNWLAVATLEEAVELRDAAIEGSILVLGGVWPGQEDIFIDRDLTPALFTLEQAELLNDAAQSRNVKVNVHAKIDTGMGRVGFRYVDIDQIASRLSRLTNIDIEGLMSHFAVADDLAASEFSQLQLKRFNEAVEIFRVHGVEPRYTDMANSPGAVAIENSRYGLVRLGGVLYGLGGDVLPSGIEKPDLKSVMSVQSRIAMIKRIGGGESIGYGRTYVAEKETVIATVPIGYHDGLRRNLSNQGKMIVRGQFVPIVGRVSMDWTTIDVTGIDGVSVGDEVTIIGSDGDAAILAEDVAALLNTISYEITCGMGMRVTRIYKEKNT